MHFLNISRSFFCLLSTRSCCWTTFLNTLSVSLFLFILSMSDCEYILIILIFLLVRGWHILEWFTPESPHTWVRRISSIFPGVIFHRGPWMRWYLTPCRMYHPPFESRTSWGAGGFYHRIFFEFSFRGGSYMKGYTSKIHPHLQIYAILHPGDS